MTMDVMTKKEVLGVYQPGSAHMVGDGFPVRSLFSYHTSGADLSPFPFNRMPRTTRRK